MLESVYEVVLAYALSSRGLNVERQAPVPIVFYDMKFDEGFRAIAFNWQNQYFLRGLLVSNSVHVPNPER